MLIQFGPEVGFVSFVLLIVGAEMLVRRFRQPSSSEKEQQSP